MGLAQVVILEQGPFGIREVPSIFVMNRREYFTALNIEKQTSHKTQNHLCVLIKLCMASQQSMQYPRPFLQLLDLIHVSLCNVNGSIFVGVFHCWYYDLLRATRHCCGNPRLYDTPAVDFFMPAREFTKAIYGFCLSIFFFLSICRVFIHAYKYQAEISSIHSRHRAETA